MKKGQVIALSFFSGDKFVIGNVIEGGMGFVYQLIPVMPLSKPMCLKTAKENIDIASFECEAQAWISLSGNANIAEAIAYGYLDENACILSKWYEYTMSDINATNLKYKEIIDFVTKIIFALKNAYEKIGLIHQDIKPSNILVDSENNPYISDFGISRFSKRMMLSDVLPNRSFTLTTKTISLGSSGGTPYFMAPEIFDGVPPSVRTDIFSLGITLYNWITGEHPYYDKVLNDISDTFREQPLKRIEQSIGEDCSPLIELIKDAVRLQKRPATYDELLEILEISPFTSVRNATEEQTNIDRIVQKAIMLREQSKVSDATNILLEGINTYPDCPSLLTAYANLLIKTSQRKKALPVLTTAIDILTKNAGKYNDRLYLDPFMNLFLLYWDDKQFTKMVDLIERTWNWIEGDAVFNHYYFEVAWLFLYRGEFNKACDYLKQHFRTKQINEYSIRIFILSAWLSENKSDNLLYLTKKLISSDIKSPSMAQYIVIVANMTDNNIRKTLLAKITPNLKSMLQRISLNIGQDKSFFEKEIDTTTLEGILRGIDVDITGGKFYGSI